MTIAPPGTALHYRRRIGKGATESCWLSGNKFKQAQTNADQKNSALEIIVCMLVVPHSGAMFPLFYWGGRTG